jgi:hypothetical protein
MQPAMKATSSRRQLIVAVLLALAVVGAGVRLWAPNPSLARDIGTLLLVLWLPVIGNIISFALARVRQRRGRHAFADDAPFRPQLRVELTAAPGQVRLKAPERQCTLVVGTEGFTARLGIPLAQWMTGDQPQALAVELLRPALALPRMASGTTFTVFAGATVVGEGRVLELLPPVS